MKEFPSLRLEAYLLVCALITSFERNNHCAADLTPFEGEELRAITQESQQDSGVDHDSKGFRFRRLENSGNDYEKMFRGMGLGPPPKKGPKGQKTRPPRKGSSRENSPEMNPTQSSPLNLTDEASNSSVSGEEHHGLLTSPGTLAQKSSAEVATTQYSPTTKAQTQQSSKRIWISPKPYTSRTRPPTSSPRRETPSQKSMGSEASEKSTESSKETETLLPTIESTEGTEELETDETETEATYEKDEGIGEHTPGLLVAGKGEHSTQIGSKHINYAVIVLLLCGLVVICQLGLLTFLLTKFIIAVKDEMVPTDKEKKPKKTKKAKSKEDTKTKGKGKGKKSSPAPLPSPSGEPKKSSETETGEA
ncbi:hypothetical protein V3C99_013958 [Haemonchus contortus]